MLSSNALAPHSSSTRTHSHGACSKSSGQDVLRDIQQIISGQQNRFSQNSLATQSKIRAQMKRTGALPPCEKIETQFRRGNHQPHIALQSFQDKLNNSSMQTLSRHKASTTSTHLPQISRQQSLQSSTQQPHPDVHPPHHHQRSY